MTTADTSNDVLPPPRPRSCCRRGYNSWLLTQGIRESLSPPSDLKRKIFPEEEETFCRRQMLHSPQTGSAINRQKTCVKRCLQVGRNLLSPPTSRKVKTSKKSELSCDECALFDEIRTTKARRENCEKTRFFPSMEILAIWHPPETVLQRNACEGLKLHQRGPFLHKQLTFQLYLYPCIA